jgi:hypothetical protein
MPNFKIVFQYTQFNKGWSEVYYKTASDLATAAVIGPELLRASIVLRDPTVVLSKIRVSDTVNNRSSLIQQLNLQNGGIPAGPEPSGVAALISLNSQVPPASRKVWVRGLVDNFVSRNPLTGADSPPGNLVAAINDWILRLALNLFAIRSLVRLGPPPNNYTNILSITPVVGGGQVTFNVAPGPVLNVGQLLTVTLINQKTFPGLKGLFSVIASTATTVVVAYNSTLVGPVVLTKGRFRQANYNYGVIVTTGSGFAGFVTRSTGRSPLGGRGAKRGARGLRSQ